MNSLLESRAACDATASWNIGLYEVSYPSGEILTTPPFRSLYGLAKEESPAVVAILSHVHPDDIAPLRSALTARTRNDTQTHFDVIHRVVPSDGKTRWLHLKGKVIWSDDLSPARRLGTRGSVVDVTEKVELELELRRLRWRFQEAVRASQLGIFDHDHKEDAAGENVYWSQEQRQLLGVGADVRGGVEAFCSLVHPDDLPALVKAATLAHQPERDGYYDVEHRIIRPDGETRWILTRSSTYFQEVNGQRSPLRTVGAMLDITERKRADEAIEQQAAILDATPDFVAISKPSGELVYLNCAARNFLGLAPNEALSTHRMMDARPIATADATWTREAELATLHGSWSGQSEFYRHDGQLIPMSQMLLAHRDEQGDVVRFSTIARDLSHEKALQESTRQSQKMEAVGRLAGGVAHDFNNILSVILAFAAVASETLGIDNPGRSAVDEIVTAAERAALLTRQLLAFSRKQIIHPKIIDVNFILASMGPMVRRLVGEAIEVQLKPSWGQPLVKADSGHLEQILLNLSVNAKDAMPHGGSLSLTVRCETVEDPVLFEAGPSPGSYVLIIVSDTGIGMSQETQEHIFEPFFTTKDPTQGTGLGLATVFGIVAQCGGCIVVDSKLDQGTTFRVYLPQSNESQTQADIASTRHRPAPKGCLLLVEDDTQLRNALRTVLERSGFTVTAAATPLEALEIARCNSRSFDLLITDVVMPKMNGKQLAQQLVELRGPLPVLYISGYTNETIDRGGILDKGIHFLPKPIAPKQLLAAVERILTGSHSVN